VLSVPPVCSVLLARFAPSDPPVTALALAQVRHLPGHLAASIAGIVVSAALCAAMAIMVHSFRVSLEDWLGGVVGADLYLRTGAGGETGYLTAAQQARIASLPEVSGIEALRYDRLAMTPDGPPLTLVARPINARVLSASSPSPAACPRARRANASCGSPRPPATCTAGTPAIASCFRSAASASRPASPEWFDYARTWSTALIPIEDYREITGDARATTWRSTSRPAPMPPRSRPRSRAALPDAPALAIEESASLLARALEIFDRSFAVTYALEAIAIVIGLAGVTSSFAALAWSRRREFGVLRFLGLTRREILRMLALEGAAAGAMGALLGLLSGIAISAVLVHVVNRQSFHWSLEMHWPVAALVAFLAALVALCAVAARSSGAFAVRHEAILAGKDDA
jgi:putative ABC transport system permease protein